MLRLVRPEERYLKSYIEAFDEYMASGVDGYPFHDARETDVLKYFDDMRHARNLKPNRVGADFYWLVDDDSDTFVGEIAIRHRLTPALERYGGHIGYGVRYSHWNRGCGTLMLRLALEKARKLGLTDVLITCDDDNPASARVMEKNGFALRDRVENIVDGKHVLTRRYWRNIVKC